MYTLASDTSTKTASVALLSDEVVIAEIGINIEKKHGETLLPAIETLLSIGNVDIEEIGLFAVTVGPGSFTGLRVGASTIKGLALAMQKPVMGVSSLDALAMNISNMNMTSCPMLDAKRGQIYTALYSCDEKTGVPEKIAEERVVETRGFLEGLKGEFIFLGDGAKNYKTLIREILPERSFFAPPHFNDIKAATVGLLGVRKFNQGNFMDPANLNLRYLRVSYAELKG
jgi:tRNA threonylcarbamoyladenosine biosynthesis protein TsaB